MSRKIRGNQWIATDYNEDLKDYTLRALQSIGKIRKVKNNATGFRVVLDLHEPCTPVASRLTAGIVCNHATGKVITPNTFINIYFVEGCLQNKEQVRIEFSLRLNSQTLPEEEHNPWVVRNDIERFIEAWPNGLLCNTT